MNEEAINKICVEWAEKNKGYIIRSDFRVFKAGYKAACRHKDAQHKQKAREFEQSLHPDYTTNDTPYISYSRVKRLIRQHFGAEA